MLNPLIPVMISVEYQPTLHNHTFRGSIGDLSTLSPDCIPSWILELIIDVFKKLTLEILGSQRVSETCILNHQTPRFQIARFSRRVELNLMYRFSKLTANRMLRLKKLIQYIADKLKIEIDPECYGGSKNVNGHYMELYWNDKVMPPGITLATVKYVLSKGQGKDIVLMYLEKQKI